jgi:hypothetical protein
VLAGQQRRRHDHRHLLPAMAATKAARSATSVLPKPTSPQISRSIGLPRIQSSNTSRWRRSWSSVSA